MVSDIFKRIDKQLVNIMETYGLDDPVNFINILNKVSEKKKFFEIYHKGIEYNPQFTYNEIPKKFISEAKIKLDDILMQLNDLEVTTGVGYLLNNKAKDLQSFLNLINNIGINKVTKYSKELYGFPSEDLIKEAYLALEAEDNSTQPFDKELDEKKYSAKDFKNKSDKFFSDNNVGWKTILKTNHDLDGRFKTVNVKQEFWVNEDSAPFSERDIIKATEHEIKVHVMRLEAGKQSSLKILAYGTKGYLPTEEGLTTYFENLKNANNPLLTKKKYLYVITESLAVKKGFYDCFDSLVKEDIDIDLAWDIVVRIKRGLKDTSEAGGFFKDHVYFLGDKLVKEFISIGGDVNKLFCGKIGIDDLKYLE